MGKAKFCYAQKHLSLLLNGLKFTSDMREIGD
jgi:hypothetical protein